MSISWIAGGTGLCLLGSVHLCLVAVSFGGGPFGILVRGAFLVLPVCVPLEFGRAEARLYCMGRFGEKSRCGTEQRLTPRKWLMNLSLFGFSLSTCTNYWGLCQSILQGPKT